MSLSLSPSSSLVRNNAKNTFLGGRLAYFRNLIAVALLSASQFASAQNPNQLGQASRVPSNTHPDSISHVLDGTVLEGHGYPASDKLLLHAVLGAEVATGAILPNGEKVSDGPIMSAELDIYASKGPWSFHVSGHDIIPIDDSDSLQLEQVLSSTLQYDGSVFGKNVHAAVGLRQFTHSSRHEHIEIEDDGHGHKSVHTTKEEVQEKYTALMMQLGVDITRNTTLIGGVEYDLGIDKDPLTDETHLFYAGFDYHREISPKAHIAFRLLAAYSFANEHEPDAFFTRYGAHFDYELFKHLYITCFAEGVTGKHRDSELFGGVGVKWKP